VLAFAAILCIAVGAGGAAALNQWWEADIDAGMKRTARRPLPSGRMERESARDFGFALSGGAVVVMGLANGWLAASILAVSIFYYSWIYTVWLKPRTPQNIVIGGARAPSAADRLGGGDRPHHADAGPAVPDHLPVDAAAFLGARAVREDRLRQGRHSDAAGGGGREGHAAADSAYTLALLPVTVAPWWLGGTGAIYGVAAVVLGLGFPCAGHAGGPARACPMTA
jgi:protoheme IX farnesyltransferase